MEDTHRRSVLKSIGTAAALSGGVGVAAAGERSGASADQTIVEIAQNNDFDLLVAAVKEAGLVGALSGDRQLTVFAPTDQAFRDLANALGVAPADLLERNDLTQILLYHVTPGRRYASSVTNPAPVQTLEGSAITVSGTALNGGGVGGAEITATNIEASNGVVHVIDGVLLPDSIRDAL